MQQKGKYKKKKSPAEPCATCLRLAQSGHELGRDPGAEGVAVDHDLSRGGHVIVERVSVSTQRVHE